MVWQSRPSGDTPFRRASIRSVNNQVEVDDAEIRLFGRRTVLDYVSDGTQPKRRRRDDLGRWHHYRGQSFVCRSEDIGRPTIRRVEEYGRRRILPGKRGGRRAHRPRAGRS